MAQRLEEEIYSVDEYLAQEEQATEKHEYYGGRIYQMAGSSPEHSIITSNATFALMLALHGKNCIAYSSDVHLQVKPNNFFTYADVSVVCGVPQYVPGRTNRMLTNPCLIVEVLSPSTENYDRGAKFRLYKGLESFQDYLLIDSREVYVQHFRKLAPNSWLEKTYDEPHQILPLENLDIRLNLADLYNHVRFDPAPSPVSHPDLESD